MLPRTQLVRQIADAARDDARPGAAELAAARAFAEAWLERVLPEAGEPPLRLHVAMREAVLGGGKRVRPALAAMTAFHYGPLDAAAAELAGRLAAALELVHCASLVHDDLPAFDDAETRRGRPSCHVAWGEPTAILVGDALLTLAFEVLGAAPLARAEQALSLVRLLGDATGSRRGIISGQSLESEPTVELGDYHARKTAALFRAAAAGGAIAAGHGAEAPRWAVFGELVGIALQLRDDLDDAIGTAEAVGKPVRVDAARGRPSAVTSGSVEEAVRALCDRVDEARALLDAFDPGRERTNGLRAVLQRVAGGYARRGP